MNDFSNISDPQSLTPEVLDRVARAVEERAWQPLHLECAENIQARGCAFAEWWLAREDRSEMSPQQMASKLESFGLRPTPTAFCMGHLEFHSLCPSCIVAAAMRQASKSAMP
ncbi:MAG TPA: hypothetical protein VIM73_18215 [Polyangiaceae bacterium]